MHNMRGMQPVLWVLLLQERCDAGALIVHSRCQVLVLLATHGR